MQYLLSMTQPDGVVPDRAFLDAVMARLDVIRTDLVDAGAWTGSAGLTPADAATVVAHRDAGRVVTDGPYAEGAEHVGGFYLIDVADLDAAIDWADRIAEATGLPMEIRPIAFSTFG